MNLYINVHCIPVCLLDQAAPKMIVSITITTRYKSSLNNLLLIPSYVCLLFKKENMPKNFIVKMNVVNVNISVK